MNWYHVPNITVLVKLQDIINDLTHVGHAIV
jgi:hypothetical protein